MNQLIKKTGILFCLLISFSCMTKNIVNGNAQTLLHNNNTEFAHFINLDVRNPWPTNKRAAADSVKASLIDLREAMLLFPQECQ